MKIRTCTKNVQSSWTEPNKDSDDSNGEHLLSFEIKLLTKETNENERSASVALRRVFIEKRHGV